MKSIIQYIREIIFLLGEDRGKLPWMMFLFFAVSMLDLAGLSLIAPYVALVVNPESITNEGYRDIFETFGLPLEKEPLLLIIGFGLLVVFMVKMISAIFINRTIITFSQQQQVRLRSFLMQAYQQLPYTEYLQRNSAEYIHSVQQLSGQFATGVVLFCLKTLSEGIVGIVIIGLLAWTNGKALGVLVFLLVGLVLGYDRIFRRNLHTYGQKMSEASTKMVKGIHEGIEGLKEIRILKKEQHFYQMVREGAAEYAHNNVMSQLISSIPRYLLEFIMIMFVVMLVAVTLLLDQSLEALVPTLAVFGIAAMRLIPSANVLSGSLIQLRINRHAVTLLYKDLLSLKVIKDQEEPSAQNKIDGQFRTFDILHIKYQYPGTKICALKDVSMKIRAGESIGIIGPSGSGKTTIVDILLGLLVPQKGKLLYNGHPVSNTLDDWRSQVAYIPQQIFLIDNTLRNNVALGLDEAEIDETRLIKVLHQARLAELVEQLPQGINTLLGERGVRLSGGQRQRIALARAFYHGRNVLVMDEATSALDNETEQEIVDEIQCFQGDKTMIVIAHRLTTVQNCDRIYRMHDGRIVDVGTPQEILNMDSPLSSSSLV